MDIVLRAQQAKFGMEPYVFALLASKISMVLALLDVIKIS